MADQNRKWLTFWSVIFEWVIITLCDELHVCVYIYITNNVFDEIYLMNSFNFLL
jgi:hypothetical protein